MEQDFDASRPEERAMLTLRRLYELYGYRRYKVSNFEEYGLYLQYKSFLSGDKILSFTDLDGRLLALRPDVTLSIIKNAREDAAAKAYYIEKVYRESKESNTFKEINQMGLEYMGRVDGYVLAETVQLAAQSLAAIDSDYILELGHMGFAGGLLEKLEISTAERGQIIAGLAAKSPHQLKKRPRLSAWPPPIPNAFWLCLSLPARRKTCCAGRRISAPGAKCRAPWRS